MSAANPAIDADLERAYLGGQGRPHWPATIARLAAASAEVLAGSGVARDLAYGPHPRQRFDLVPAVGPTRGVVLHLHPGYWQMRDRTGFACLAPVFTTRGCDAVFADYPLAPEASVAEITEAARGIVPAVAAESRRRHGRVLPIVACGHSAGGHLAIELAMTDRVARGEDCPPIAAVIALSGVFDLAPLVATSLNVKLGLDAAAARAASPIRRVGAIGAPALIAVGGGETAAFHDQSRAMAAAWAAAGHAIRLEIVGDDDHFSLLDTLRDPASALAQAVAETIATAVG